MSEVKKEIDKAKELKGKSCNEKLTASIQKKQESADKPIKK